MSILIKGMEMPKGSRYCKFTEMNENWERVCTIGGRYQWHSLLLCDDCPLIEVPTPHGRLIDADILERDIEQYHLSDGKFQHWVQAQNSIIEAEEDSHE